MGVRAAGVAMALMSHSKFEASGKCRQQPIMREERSSYNASMPDGLTSPPTNARSNFRNHKHICAAQESMHPHDAKTDRC